jgi:hypothetical protein
MDLCNFHCLGFNREQKYKTAGCDSEPCLIISEKY